LCDERRFRRTRRNESVVCRIEATDARIGDNSDLAVGPDGTLYIADEWSGRVRAVNGDGVIDTVPGTRASRPRDTDGPKMNG
jgi:hypothetical protein